MRVIGNVDGRCPAAVLVYKADGTEVQAESEIGRLQKKVRVGGEVHDAKQSFLNSLAQWNGAVDPGNAFLCIYSHMGAAGLCCVKNDPQRLVTWSEVAQALERRVEVVWLVGCHSREAVPSWSGTANPVLHFLAATSDSKYFLPLVPVFGYEISFTPSFAFVEMPAIIRQIDSKMADVTDYLEVVNGQFRALKVDQNATPDLLKRMQAFAKSP